MADPLVDAGLAAWLKTDAIYTASAPAGIVEKWGALAATQTAISPLAYKSGAIDEAARQGAFLAGPLVRDEHVVQGLRHDLLGKAIRITGNDLGYSSGVIVFVIKVQESDTADMTTLTVLRRLA